MIWALKSKRINQSGHIVKKITVLLWTLLCKITGLTISYACIMIFVILIVLTTYSYIYICITVRICDKRKILSERIIWAYCYLVSKSKFGWNRITTALTHFYRISKTILTNWEYTYVMFSCFWAYWFFYLFLSWVLKAFYIPKLNSFRETVGLIYS